MQAGMNFCYHALGCADTDLFNRCCNQNSFLLRLVASIARRKVRLSDRTYICSRINASASIDRSTRCCNQSPDDPRTSTRLSAAHVAVNTLHTHFHGPSAGVFGTSGRVRKGMCKDTAYGGDLPRIAFAPAVTGSKEPARASAPATFYPDWNPLGVSLER